MRSGKLEDGLRQVLPFFMWALVAGPAVWLLIAALTGHLSADPIDALQRATGRWTLRYLVASLSITPLMRLTRFGWLIVWRRFLGLSAFFWATGHLFVYVILDWFFDWNEMWKDLSEHWYIALGMFAFVLLIPLALTSTRSSIRRLGARKWVRLHSLVYLVAVAASLHYFQAIKKDISQPILYSGIIAMLLALRLLWGAQRHLAAPRLSESRQEQRSQPG